jgi:hypothetical protein
VLGLVLTDGSNVRERKSSKVEPTPSTRAGGRRIFTRRADARFAALAESSFHWCCENLSIECPGPGMLTFPHGNFHPPKRRKD